MPSVTERSRRRETHQAWTKPGERVVSAERDGESEPGVRRQRSRQAGEL
jgi:hypothetical protein